MANNVANFPYSFTTTLASFKAATGAAPATGPLNISQILWLAPVAAGDSFIVNNEFGQVIGTLVATAATVTTGFYSLMFQPSLRVHDFQVPTMASGTLFIYTD
jgi:hypothetical protein